MNKKVLIYNELGQLLEEKKVDTDNALNLEAVADPERRLKLSKKYLPVIEVFILRLDKAQDILSEEKIIEMKSRLTLAVENIKDFIKTQETV